MNPTDQLHCSSLAFIASVVEKRVLLLNKVNCLECTKVFGQNRKTDVPFTCTQYEKTPCSSTFEICAIADRFIQLELMDGSIHFNLIYQAIFEHLNKDTLFENTDFSSHLPNETDHKIDIIRSIIDVYVHIKATYVAKNATRDAHSALLRNNLRKLVHNYNQ